MAQRLLAVLGAVAIVVVAIAVRAAIDGDGGGSGPAAGRRLIICATDLGAACDGLRGVTVIREEPAVTAEKIASATLPHGADGWVTTASWTEVAEARAHGQVDERESLARSTIIVAVDAHRASAVTALCTGASPWRCLGDNAGVPWETLGHGGLTSWGSLKTGLPSADAAVGLDVLASTAMAFFDGSDFALDDFDGSGFRDWLDTFTAASGHGEPTPVGTLVTARGKYTAVADVAASVGDRDVSVLDGPGVEATVVLAHLRGGQGLHEAGALREALVAAGWQRAAGPAPRPPLKPGVLAALHTLWMEVTR